MTAKDERYSNIETPDDDTDTDTTAETSQSEPIPDLKTLDLNSLEEHDPQPKQHYATARLTSTAKAVAKPLAVLTGVATLAAAVKRSRSTTDDSDR